MNEYFIQSDRWNKHNQEILEGYKSWNKVGREFSSVSKRGQLAATVAGFLLFIERKYNYGSSMRYRLRNWKIQVFRVQFETRWVRPSGRESHHGEQVTKRIFNAAWLGHVPPPSRKPSTTGAPGVRAARCDAGELSGGIMQFRPGTNKH